jgi:hypothetical protein
MLRSWEEVLKRPALPVDSLQGKTRTFTDAQIAFTVHQWQSYTKERKRTKIKAFVKHLRKQWQQQSWLTPAPSRKTIEDMLIANGYRKPKSSSAKKPGYYPKVKRYFPHVQTVLDGKEVVVTLGGDDYPFIMELTKDMATDAIGGYAIGSSETAELVKQAFADHSRNNPSPLAVLVDNGKGNSKAAIDLGASGVLVIKAHPGRAETKGQLEGEFGLFERKVSHIEINGQNEPEKAMSILKKIAEVYLRLRNQTPRCSACPFTPGELMKAKLDPADADKMKNG